MCEIIKNAKTECCSKLEIFFPSLAKKELEHIIRFLYHGQLSHDEDISTSEIQCLLTKLLGFPDDMKFSEGLSTDKYDIEMKESYNESEMTEILPDTKYLNESPIVKSEYDACIDDDKEETDWFESKKSKSDDQKNTEVFKSKSDTLKKNGRKDDGICPHCGEVIFSNI